MRRLVAGAVLSFVAASRRDYRLLINQLGRFANRPNLVVHRPPQRPRTAPTLSSTGPPKARGRVTLVYFDNLTC